MDIGIGTQQCRVLTMYGSTSLLAWEEKGCNELWYFICDTPHLASSPALSLVGNPKRELGVIRTQCKNYELLIDGLHLELMKSALFGIYDHVCTDR